MNFCVYDLLSFTIPWCTVYEYYVIYVFEI